MLEIMNSVAVITGGASGIGKALAIHWISNGGKVVLGDISFDELQRTKEELQEKGGDVAITACDVTKEKDNHHLAKFAAEQFGAINLIAPCAGITKDGFMLSTDRDTGKVVKKMSLEQFQSVIDVNLTGTFLTIRECAEQMIELSCMGLICLFSSIGSLGTAGQINYSSTKAAMSVMPKVITAEFARRNLGHRIRCIAIAPGYVATPMVAAMAPNVLNELLQQVPIKRLIYPEEVVSLIAELYRNEAISGEIFHINGGLRLGSMS